MDTEFHLFSKRGDSLIPDSIGFEGIDNKSNNLVKITDILGRTINEINNKILFYIYDDGMVKKKIIVE